MEAAVQAVENMKSREKCLTAMHFRWNGLTIAVRVDGIDSEEAGINQRRFRRECLPAMLDAGAVEVG